MEIISGSIAADNNGLENFRKPVMETGELKQNSRMERIIYSYMFTNAQQSTILLMVEISSSQ